MTATDGVKAFTATEFMQRLQQSGIIFVDFWAEWCAPCLQFAPIYASVAANYPDVVFASIDIKQEPELAEVFQVQSIPHLMVFKHGIAIYSESGSVPESILHELVTQAQQADVSALSGQLKRPD